MQKKSAMLMLISTFVYAAYNPFFVEDPAPKQVKQAREVIIKEYKNVPKVPRKSIEMAYFGFVESNKGTYALVSFNEKNIIIQRDDSIYDDENIYRVEKITSNYILIKDKAGRTETVYFSSEVRR